MIPEHLEYQIYESESKSLADKICYDCDAIVCHLTSDTCQNIIDVVGEFELQPHVWEA